MSNSRQNTTLNLLSKGILLFLCLILYAFSNAQQSNEDIDQLITENNKKIADYIKDGNINAAAELYNQSAYLLRQAERLSEAADLYKKVLEINTELGNRQGQMITHSSLAMVFLEAENYPKALFHLYKELEFRKQVGNKSEIINVLANIALAENEMLSFDSAIENIEIAIALAKEFNDLSLLKRCYGVAYDIFSKQGNNNEKAHSYYELYSTIDRKLKEQKMTEITTEADLKVTKAFTEKQITENKLSKTNEELEKTVTSLQKVEELTREQQMELELKESKISEQKALIETKRLRIKYLVIGIGCLFIFIILLTFMILKIRRANKKINEQRSWLEKQNKEIKSSITYAQTIQQAMLPANSEIERYFESFILYLPKDIVSGDFYWISTQESQNKQIIYFAMVDCTGHGVPGAFMSMIGNRLLNEIVNEKKIASPAEVLEILNLMIRKALRQEQTDNNDGMDLALCKFEKMSEGKYHLVFSGAKRPIYVIKNSENKLIALRGDRKSIGGYSLNKGETSFNNHTLDIEKGDLIYMFSDGILDQNNPDRKKFGRIRLEEALIDCAKLPPLEQKKIIEQRLNKYIENEEQRDDITLIGLKII